jgi:large subunit ribosomal protein L21
MYAIVDIAGQQFKVAKSDTVTTNRLAGEVGSKVEIDHVLLLSTDKAIKVGTPYVDGAKVQAVILAHDKADKVLIFKKRRRKGYRLFRGHRQSQTQLKIEEIIA